LLAVPGKEVASKPGLALWQKPAPGLPADLPGEGAPAPLHQGFVMQRGRWLLASRYDGGFGGAPDAAPTSGLFAPC
jgi:hypothetical protein